MRSREVCARPICSYTHECINRGRCLNQHHARTPPSAVQTYIVVCVLCIRAIIPPQPLGIVPYYYYNNVAMIYSRVFDRMKRTGRAALYERESTKETAKRRSGKTRKYDWTFRRARQKQYKPDVGCGFRCVLRGAIGVGYVYVDVINMAGQRI